MPQTNKEIFQNDLFAIPQKYSEQSFPVFIKETFEKYINTIQTFSGSLKERVSDRLDFIKQQTTHINTAIEKYYDGFPALAYYHIAEALDALEKEQYLPIQKTEIITNRESFYRMRVSENKTLKKDDLFHIPFNIREKVSTQRYSIPGLPCLYLADSTFVCWEELGRPNLDSLHVSRFDLSKSDFKLLYFNQSTNEIRQKCFTKKHPEGTLLNTLIGYLCYWPIFCACSILVKKQNEVFKPEYIIPQLLLQWIVSTQKLDGVLYKSNRVAISNHNFGTFSNIVIPAKVISDVGFCSKLKSKVKLTNPMSWQILEIAGAAENKPSPTMGDLRRAMYIELIEGEKTDYSESKFGKMENKLKTLSSSLIT
jgi:hypothetical protein